MRINLPILPLHIIDSFSFQKCLLPKGNFPREARPGQWTKCYFYEAKSQKQYYSVNQIFPSKEIDAVCYLDTTVSNLTQQNDRNLILDKIILLASSKESRNVDVEFHIEPKFFVENCHYFSKTYLLEMSEILLQQYQLVHDCLIKDTFLRDNGIDSIHVAIEDNSDDSTQIITDNTHVQIKNVSLTYRVSMPDLVLYVDPLTTACLELEDLMKVLRMQRNLKKRPFCMNQNAILVGASGCGKTTLINDFLQRHCCNVFNIKITDCLKQYPGETEAELRKIFTAACDFETKFKSNDPTVILLEEIHLLCPQPSSNNTTTVNYMRICAQLLTSVDELFTSGKNIMCLATTSKPDDVNGLFRRPGRFVKDIFIAPLQEAHRCEILKKLFQQSLPNFNIEHKILELAARQTRGYVLADLALFVRNVTLTVLTKPDKNFENVVVEMLKNSNPISLKGTDVTAYKTTETFESIGGMMHVKKVLEVSVLAGLKHQESFKRFNLSLPKGILLYGPPGCAKTTVAKCLATEANMTFLATSSAEVYSPYVGCAEKFITKIFQTARKNSPCLIFLDEIDSLVGRRSLSGSSNSNDVQTRILSTLLTEMDGIIASTTQNCNIMVLAATNRPDMVDDALMRPGRFDKLIHIPAPDLLSRRSILELYKRKMPFSKSIDLDSIAARTENYSGADICNICNETALHAFQRDIHCEQIIMEDFENVLKLSKSSLNQQQIDWYCKFENQFV